MPHENAPAHEHVYHNISRRVLFGEMHPGMTVTLQGIADTLSVSLTPVREAVRRLIAQGALEFHGNRRISVPELPIERLDEIHTARCMLETELAIKAVTLISPTEIDAVEAFDLQLDEAIKRGDVGGYLQANHDFHFTIYRAAQSQVILPIVESLWLQFGPCLRVACGRFGTSNLTDQHKLIIEALRDKSAEQVASALREDIEQGYSFVCEERKGSGAYK